MLCIKGNNFTYLFVMTTYSFIYREDTTQTGHLLGPAQHLSKQATPERDLSPVACTIIRLIIHAALVWGSVCVKVRIVRSFIFKLSFLH